MTLILINGRWGDRRDLNPQPLDPQSSTPPIELRSPCFIMSLIDENEELLMCNFYDLMGAL